ncbi:hypothetical protein B0H15DRAFT_953378 [Mycena belliarum]|uniref:Uncharacterized protein n=1 Tax=Mycena belliarum TaxID=1033014 RepID=A0AAD6U0P4_9AGAR|nr:hypothetical protein B0H15DRAFT_953378 [Mycena belliae]
MAAGRKPLDPQDKAKRRKASLARYAEKNADRLRDAARLRAQRSRSSLADADSTTLRKHKERAHKAAAGYRERNRDKIRAADSMRRAQQRKQTTQTEGGLDASGSLPLGSSTSYAAKQRRPKQRRPWPRNNLDTGEEEEEDASPALSAASDFGFRVRAEPRYRCPEGCDEEACEGCACICGASTRWLPHEHYRTDAWKAAGCP